MNRALVSIYLSICLSTHFCKHTTNYFPRDSLIFTRTVWSWAVTMWEVFSYGTQPYRGYKLQEVLKMVRAGYRLERPDPCPEDTFAVLQSCWNVNRTERMAFSAIADTMKEHLVCIHILVYIHLSTYLSVSIVNVRVVVII